MASGNHSKSTLLAFTDCVYFTNGNCAFNGKCYYRHCEAAIQQLEECPNWPETCRNVNCRYRHMGTASKASKPVVQERGLVIFFWDIENAPIPRGQKPFDIAQRIRQKLVTERGLQEADFSCYGNSNTISQENQDSLHHATVRIIHVSDRKKGAIDRQIMLDLDRFGRVHRPPATIVLISGDIDFVGKLSDLRHQARFHVIVIHSKPVQEELARTVNEHYPWDLFFETVPQPVLRTIARDETARLTNSTANFSSFFKYHLNNENMTTSTTTENFKPSIIKPLLRSPGENTHFSTNNQQPKPPRQHQRFRSATRNRRTRDRSLSSKPYLGPRPNSTLISDANNSTSPTAISPAVVPQSYMRRTYSTTQLNQQDISIYSPSEQIRPTLRDYVATIPSSPLRCPYCTNEFMTIIALRQHQNDNKHLFDCPACNEGFQTLDGLKQHQATKGHHDSADPLSAQDSTTQVAHSLPPTAENTCGPMHQNLVADDTTIEEGFKNILKITSDKDDTVN